MVCASEAIDLFEKAKALTYLPLICNIARAFNVQKRRKVPK